jgi:hypothetical protein
VSPNGDAVDRLLDVGDADAAADEDVTGTVGVGLAVEILTGVNDFLLRTWDEMVMYRLWCCSC